MTVIVDAFMPSIPRSISTHIIHGDISVDEPLALRPKHVSSCPALHLQVKSLDIPNDASITSTSVASTVVSDEDSLVFSSPSILIPHKSLASQLNVELEMVGFNDVRASHQPKVVGHRGSLYRSLENTRHSIRLAAEHCSEVEIDVFLLKCGALVVFHGGGSDKNPGCLKDYCNINGSILDLTYEQARQLKFNPHYQEFGCGPAIIEQLQHEYYIPTLEEVLCDAKKTRVTIKAELKGPGTAEPVLELVEKLDMVDQVHYSSFEHSRIKMVRELRPELNPDGSHRYKTGALFDEVPQDFVEQALDAGATEVHLKYSTCTKERVRQIHDAGMDSMIWMRGPIGMQHDMKHRFHDVENEDESMYRTIIATGVKAMCVNKPDVLANLLMKQM